MSNFLFLERQFPELKASMEKAESLAEMDPEMAIIMARKASEQLIKWISMQVNTVGMKGKMVNELLSNNDFKKLVPNEILQKMHGIKNVGNRVIHENYIVDESLAYDVIENLYQICTWFFSKFSSFDLTIIGNEENIDIGLIEDDLSDFDDEECDFTVFSKLEKFAKNGNAEAQYRLGQCFEFGKGTDQDVELAFDYYEQSANQGYASAILKISKFQIFGLYTNKNYKQAFSNLSKLDSEDIHEAYYLKAKCLENGWGINKDTELAFTNYLRASDLGYSESHFKVGWCYQYGKGIKTNLKRAFHYYKLASSYNKYAYYQMAECYRLGEGVEINHSYAIENYMIFFDLYTKNSRNNDMDWYDESKVCDNTIHYIVEYSLYGINGVLEKNILLALNILEKGYTLKNQYSMNRLCKMYETGELASFSNQSNVSAVVERLNAIVIRQFPWVLRKKK